MKLFPLIKGYRLTCSLSFLLFPVVFLLLFLVYIVVFYVCSLVSSLSITHLLNEQHAIVSTQNLISNLVIFRDTNDHTNWLWSINKLNSLFSTTKWLYLSKLNWLLSVTWTTVPTKQIVTLVIQCNTNNCKQSNEKHQ